MLPCLILSLQPAFWHNTSEYLQLSRWSCRKWETIHYCAIHLDCTWCVKDIWIDMHLYLMVCALAFPHAALVRTFHSSVGYLQLYCLVSKTLQQQPWANVTRFNYMQDDSHAHILFYRRKNNLLVALRTGHTFLVPARERATEVTTWHVKVWPDQPLLQLCEAGSTEPVATGRLSRTVHQISPTKYTQ